MIDTRDERFDALFRSIRSMPDDQDNWSMVRSRAEDIIEKIGPQDEVLRFAVNSDGVVTAIGSRRNWRVIDNRAVVVDSASVDNPFWGKT